MNIIPAIDLQNGKCVRLVQGKLNKAIIYNESPVQQAVNFELAGCKKIHIIDLDAAINGLAKNKKIIMDIKKSVSIKIQLGGGIRNYEKVKFWFDNGINNLIIGSMALKQPKLLLKIIKEFPDKIIIAIDDNNSKLMISGWLEESNKTAKSIASYYEDQKLRSFIFTDINRDGTLLGLNISKINEFVQSTKHRVIVGGGLKSLKDIKNICSLNQKNIEGVILGKAYYSGSIKLNEALRTFKDA